MRLNSTLIICIINKFAQTKHFVSMKRIIALFLFNVFVLYITAQSGRFRVTGKVIDSSSDEPLPGVCIIIEGTTTGTITDLEGKYDIMVTGKEQTLIYSFLGFIDEKVVIGESQVININMIPNLTALGEVVVTAQAKGQKSAVLEQINSNTLKNVVAADRLQENPDANATEAIGRLPGISVVRSGGEGTGLVVRGLSPRYTSVTLNGIELPSTGGDTRETNLNGISQYALQGAEVYKSLTADMEANSVAGSVNLKLRKTPRGLHFNLMAQGGYNNLNNYWGNYKYLVEISNRFFDDKLGILFTGNLEKVNRSVQTLNGGYEIEGSTEDAPILLSSFGLNDITSIIERRSAMLSADYQLTQRTTILLYGMYTGTSTFNETQTKNYSTESIGGVSYNFTQSPNKRVDIFQGALNGESNFSLLNSKAEYGVAYSRGKNNNHGKREWNFRFDLDSTAVFWSTDLRETMDPREAAELFYDDADNIDDNYLLSISTQDSKIDDENFNAYLDYTVPFNLGERINGTVKMGGKYHQKNRIRDDLVGTANLNGNYNVAATELLSEALDWIVLNDGNNITAAGISEGNTDEFLDGTVDFGNRFSFDRLNEISDAWEDISEYYLAQGTEVYLPVFGAENKIGYAQDIANILMNDQDISDTYWAGYLMSEINIGKHIMFIPGIRYEKTNTTMKGYYVRPPQIAPNISEPVAGHDTTATNAIEFLLPMIHLRVKYSDKAFVHLAYTKTLSRPDFNAISPNYYVNSGFSPLTYTAGNPDLEPELWSNYDIQFTYHENKIGLLSATLFYKNVQNRIWERNYKRISTDPIPDPSFAQNSTVDMSVWENSAYDGHVKGVEFEWQTSFYYLPKPFGYFTLSANYTFSDSEIKIPTYWLETVTSETGRPTQFRVDTVKKSRIPYQPRHIANVSLGFNRKGFNAWLSYQYNGEIFIDKNLNDMPQLDKIKDYFYRWDLQITQKFKIKNLDGFEFLLNVANISNYMEIQHHSGTERYTYMEQYGWTADLGLRYRY